MLQRLRQTLVLLLFLLLPFHAFFVTVGTKLILGPGHPPLPYLAVWKELLMVVIFVIGILEIATYKVFPRYFQYMNILNVGQRETMRMRWKADTSTILIITLFVLALVIQIPNSHFPIPISQLVFGFKYLFLPLIFFLLLKNLSWDEDFLERKVFPGLLFVSGIVAACGILTYFLPQSFFTALGYSDAHSLYSPDAPLSAFQQIAGIGIRRIQGTFAGPNQLGLWLLLPWSISLVFLLRGKNQELRIRNQEYLNSYFFIHNSFLRFVCLLFLAIVLFLTFSRAAWIGAGVILILACFLLLQRRTRIIVCSFFVCSFFVAIVALALTAPQLLLKGISSGQHLQRMQEGVAAILEQPLGRGLGSAGPASNRLQDACVYFPDGADTSWARSRNDLCIFVGDAQVQPLLTERTCACAFLPENWYVQVGVELGILGLVLFVALVVFILRSLLLQPTTYNLQPFLAFLGISIAALFLHAWEDSAVAYTVWALAGITLGNKGVKE
ncbi:MAG: O-antigen ligase family protein [Patescibacteria group bacterium]